MIRPCLPPDPLPAMRGLLLMERKGKGGERREGRGEGRRKRGKKGREKGERKGGKKRGKGRERRACLGSK